MLFNLQGTRRFKRQVFILAHFSSFVKCFFSPFSSPLLRQQAFILPLSKAFVKCFFSPTFAADSYPNTVSLLCQVFFSLLSLPRQPFILTPYQLSCQAFSSRPSGAQSLYQTLPPLVNYFFPFSSQFSSFLLCFACCALQKNRRYPLPSNG